MMYEGDNEQAENRRRLAQALAPYLTPAPGTPPEMARMLAMRGARPPMGGAPPMMMPPQGGPPMAPPQRPPMPMPQPPFGGMGPTPMAPNGPPPMMRPPMSAPPQQGGVFAGLPGAGGAAWSKPVTFEETRIAPEAAPSQEGSEAADPFAGLSDMLGGGLDDMSDDDLLALLRGGW